MSRDEGDQVHDRRKMSFWGAVTCFAVMGAVMVLLGAEPLHHRAENLEPSVFRTAALAVTGPFATASGFLRLDWPRERVANAGKGPAGGPDHGDTARKPPAGETPGHAGGAAPRSGVTTASSTSTTATTLPRWNATTSSTIVTTTTTTLPVFTKDWRLRVLVVGDSLVGPVGFALQRRGDAYPALQVKVISKASSGLVRPDFYDWPEVLEKTVAEFQPHVTVMLFGGNEKQTMPYEGRSLQPFSEGWNAEYARRVKQALEITTATGAGVVWIGLPIMRSPKFSETARTLNSFYTAACAGHEGAVYIDGYSLFSDADGKYSPYLKDAAGDTRLMRESDGIHFTGSGGDRVADAVMRVLLDHYRLE